MTLWLLAGLDPTGGAGLIRDVWTAETVGEGCDLRCVVTAFTWQGESRQARAEPVSNTVLTRTLADVSDAKAIKLGLLPARIADQVAQRLRAVHVPVVVDPVLRATDGGWLGARPDSFRAMRRANVLFTPNRVEAALMLGRHRYDPDLGRDLAQWLAPASTLLKDAGASTTRVVCDELWHAGRQWKFERERVAGPDPRGTGCALSTAVACGLWRGRSVQDAIWAAITWLDGARRNPVRGRDARPHLSLHPR
ncbi:MAG: bifunctional hydroxymethylpyrimidine kinase/phosphomethylpyrimidine kinase [Nannocystaceae bacterium]